MASTLRISLALSLVCAASACTEDPVEVMVTEKGRIARSALEGGLTVVISSDVGSVVVPFEIAVPELADDTGGDEDAALQGELEGAVSLIVTSTNTGTTADLVDGSIVDAPTGPGEWSWSLNGSRDEAAMTFFNSTNNGLTLKDGLVYDAMLSITTNDYIESEEAFSFDVTVVVN